MPYLSEFGHLFTNDTFTLCIAGQMLCPEGVEREVETREKAKSKPTAFKSKFSSHFREKELHQVTGKQWVQKYVNKKRVGKKD